MSEHYQNHEQEQKQELTDQEVAEFVGAFLGSKKTQVELGQSLLKIKEAIRVAEYKGFGPMSELPVWEGFVEGQSCECYCHWNGKPEGKLCTTCGCE